MNRRVVRLTPDYGEDIARNKLIKKKMVGIKFPRWSDMLIWSRVLDQGIKKELEYGFHLEWWSGALGWLGDEGRKL